MTDELLQAALAGGSRSGAGSARADGPADALGEGMGVLLRAGLRDVYRQAGYVPSPAPEPFPPAPSGRESVCPRVVEPVLREMIECGPSLSSAPREAVRALARRGWVLPPGVLVPALSSRLEGPDLLPVLGARGRWLAGLNEAWQRVLAGERVLDHAEVERIWTEGSKSERVALIRQLRERDPAGARERLAPRFAREPADLRQDLLKALEVNLSSADEPFLEAALDDRSKGVRQGAAALLARLPDSAFVARMAARARRLVTRRMLGRGVALRPAPEPPADWRRDGIGPALPGGLEGEWAWTIQVLSSMPAAVLTRELEVPAQDVLEAADQYGAATLIEAWRQNAAPEDEAALLPVLWDRWWVKPLQRTMGGDTHVMLARTMPRDVIRDRVLRLLDDPPVGAEHIILRILGEVGEPWPADVSRAVLDVMRRWLDRMVRKDRNPGDWAALIHWLAARAAPETIDGALDLLIDIERAKVLPAWIAAIRQARGLLELRRRFWDAMAMAVMESMTTGGANDSGNR